MSYVYVSDFKSITKIQPTCALFRIDAGESSLAEDDEPSIETAEEEAKRALDAIEPGLVAFSSVQGAAVRESGAVPYYRLHQVVATAITGRRVIVVSTGLCRQCVLVRDEG